MTRRRPSYGWAVVAALAVTETTSWGVLYYGFGVFLTPMEDELGWSRVQLTGAFSVALACQGLAGVAVGRWLDRRSPRPLMALGSVAAVAVTLAWSRVSTVGGLYLLWAAAGAVMATVLYEPAFTVVTKWFPGEGRRAALTTLTLVAGLASTIFLPLENRLIEAHGWRDALVILAVVLGVVTIPLHALVLRAPPRSAGGAGRVRPKPGERSDDGPTAGEVARLPAFRRLVTAFVASSFVSSGLAAHQVAYLRERGYTAAFAATATGVLGAMQLPGRLLFVPLLRWWPRPAVTTATFAATTVGLGVLASVGGRGSVWLFVVVYGMGRGMSTLLRATLVGDLFGAGHYGAITGLLALCTTAALAAGPVLTGLAYEAFGGYGTVLWLLVGVAGLATVAAAGVEGRPTR